MIVTLDYASSTTFVDLTDRQGFGTTAGVLINYQYLEEAKAAADPPKRPRFPEGDPDRRRTRVREPIVNGRWGHLLARRLGVAWMRGRARRGWSTTVVRAWGADLRR